MVTGMYDHRLRPQSTEVKEEVVGSGVAATSIKCVYIFPQSIATISGVDDKDAKVRFSDLSSVAINHAYL